jgi:hypothetical protein
LREAEFLARRRQLPQQLPPAKRSLDELWELGVAVAPLVEDLVERVCASTMP